MRAFLLAAVLLLGIVLVTDANRDAGLGEATREGLFPRPGDRGVQTPAGGIMDRLAEALQMKATLLKNAQSKSIEPQHMQHHAHWFLRALPGLICCTLMLALASWLFYRSRKEQQLPTAQPCGQGSRTADKEIPRVAHHDNLKFVCIIVVIVAHFLQGCPKGVLPRQVIEIFVHSFGNPMFAIVSGVVSVLEMDDVHYRRTLHCIALFLLLQFIYSIVDLLVRKIHPHAHYPAIGNMELKPIDSFQTWASIVAGHAFYHLWYIKALFFWRLCAPCVMQFHGSLGAVTVLGILVSYADHSNGDWPRAVSFFPFFVLGLWIKRHSLLRNLEDWRKDRATMVLSAAGSVLLIHLAISCWIAMGEHDLPFEAWLTHIHDPNKQASATIWAPFIRTGVYIYQAVVSLAVWLVIPQNEKMFTKLGSRTILPYLLHPMFMYAAIFSGLYDDDLFGGSVGMRLLQQLLCILIGVLVTTFLLTKQVFEAVQTLVYMFGMKTKNGFLMRPVLKETRKKGASPQLQTRRT